MINLLKDKVKDFINILDKRDAIKGYARINFLTSDRTMVVMGIDDIFKSIKDDVITDNQFIAQVSNLITYFDMDWDGKPVINFDCKYDADKKQLINIIDDIRDMLNNGNIPA